MNSVQSHRKAVPKEAPKVRHGGVTARGHVLRAHLVCVTASSRAMQTVLVTANPAVKPTAPAMAISPGKVHVPMANLAVKVPAMAHVPKAARATVVRAPSAVKATVPAVIVLPATLRSLKANPAVPIRKANIT